MGRPAGIPNKNKRGLMHRLQELHGEDFHPILRMAENAVKLHGIAEQTADVNDLKASTEAWDRIAVYVEPKLKAVEVTGSGDDGELVVTFTRKRFDGGTDDGDE
jgi:hypothetical protein